MQLTRSRPAVGMWYGREGRLFLFLDGTGEHWGGGLAEKPREPRAGILGQGLSTEDLFNFAEESGQVTI